MGTSSSAQHPFIHSCVRVCSCVCVCVFVCGFGVCVCVCVCECVCVSFHESRLERSNLQNTKQAEYLNMPKNIRCIIKDILHRVHMSCVSLSLSDSAVSLAVAGLVFITVPLLFSFCYLINLILFGKLVLCP